MTPVEDSYTYSTGNDDESSDEYDPEAEIAADSSYECEEYRQDKAISVSLRESEALIAEQHLDPTEFLRGVQTTPLANRRTSPLSRSARNRLSGLAGGRSSPLSKVFGVSSRRDPRKKCAGEGSLLRKSRSTFINETRHLSNEASSELSEEEFEDEEIFQSVGENFTADVIKELKELAIKHVVYAVFYSCAIEYYQQCVESGSPNVLIQRAKQDALDIVKVFVSMYREGKSTGQQHILDNRILDCISEYWGQKSWRDMSSSSGISPDSYKWKGLGASDELSLIKRVMLR